MHKISCEAISHPVLLIICIEKESISSIQKIYDFRIHTLGEMQVCSLRHTGKETQKKVKHITNNTHNNDSNVYHLFGKVIV